MSILERFINYITIDSPSNPKSATCPSTDLQVNVANFLAEEMKTMGLDNVYVKEGYAYGTLPATKGYEDKDVVGFVAHMDTAPEFNGFGIKPQVLENYDGGEVVLKGSGHVLSPKDFPWLADLKGQTLITSDGTTLLGADDKAGIAEILEAVEQIMKENIPHGKIVVGFTPDEEIGRGADLFDIEGFGAKLAYTVDGGAFNGICYENFNAFAAVADFTGYSIHPGSSKNKMVNSQHLAFEFHNLLPVAQKPEYTENFEGFYHLTNTTGSTEKTTLEYIVRDHSAELIAQKEATMRNLEKFINEKYGPGSCVLTIREQYRNMKEQILPHPQVIEIAEKAIRSLDAQPVSLAARGGTDGARLSYMGLPCPNLGTGGHNAHGRFECITVESMNDCTNVIKAIIKGFAE